MQLLREGPERFVMDGQWHTHSVFSADGVWYARVECLGQSWVWELREAHWWDDPPVSRARMMIGVWRD
jgi:hypothetical protein